MRIKGSRINFGTHSIYKHPQGIYIDGKFRATQLTGQSHFQGETRGYVSGRFESSFFNDSIETFPFASDVGAEEYGNLSVVREYVAGQSSETHGYTSGGFTTAPFARYDIIDKFPFSGVTGSASDVGNLTQAREGPAGQSSTVNGYTSGGVAPQSVNTLDKFPFSSDVDAAETGTLDQARGYAAGQSSSTHGYTSGGTALPWPTMVNTIDKFPFASNTAASDVEDLTQARTDVAGQSSAESGYTSGGSTPTVPTTWVTTIDKFSFASDAAATNVGVLTQLRGGAGGQSSTTHGYTSGGRGPGLLNTIDKFPFSADIDATDVGNLEDSKDSLTGQQV